MGACCAKGTPPKHKDELLNSKPSAVVPTSSSPTYCESTPSETTNADVDAESNLPRVKLIGDALCPFTLRVLIALQFKVKCLFHLLFVTFSIAYCHILANFLNI